MNSDNIRQILRKQFPILDQSELLDLLAIESSIVEVPAAQILFEIDSYINVIPLVVKGSVKVLRREEEKDILLYYIKAGETCAMTLSSCLKREKSKIFAQAQEPTELIAIPVEAVYQLMRKYPAWQNFVIETYSQRFEEVLHALDQVAFHRMDERLLNYLEEKSKTLKTKELSVSHQAIADDLATSREVISRLLKQLERKGIISLSRAKLRLLS